MARIVQKLEEDWVTYVPDVDGNRLDENPLTVEIRPLSTEELRAYNRGLAAMGPKLSAKAQAKRADKVALRIFSDRVRNVRNYTVLGRKIETGADLFQHGEIIVQDDVWEALVNISTLSEGLLGKSSSQPASSSPPTRQLGVGAAAGAGEPSTQPPSSPTTTAGELVTASPIPTPGSSSTGPQG